MTPVAQSRLANIFLTLTVVTFFYVVYLVTWPFEVIKINNLPYPVKNPVVPAGERVVLDTDYCKYMPIPASYYAQFIATPSGTVTTLAERYVSNLETGCRRNDFSVLTPEDLEPGRYIIRLNIQYQVNPLRIIDYTLESQPFEVTYRESLSEKLDELFLLTSGVSATLDKWGIK